MMKTNQNTNSKKVLRTNLSLIQSKGNNSITNKLLNEHSYYTNKNITRMTESNGLVLVLSQSEINFVDVEISQPYEINMNIKNISSINRRVKIVNPKDQRFQLNYKKEGILAPGLSLKISIIYEPKDLNEIHTSFRILSEDDFQQQIPINVYPPAANLVFEPIINFGFIKLGKSRTEQIVISNEGIISADVKLNCDMHEIEIVPKEFNLAAKSKIKVKLILTSNATGYISGFINVLPKQRLLSEIEFSANTIEFSRFLMNDQGKEIEELQIPPILVGDKQEVNVFLVNNTPKIFNFRIAQKKGNQNNLSSVTTPEEVGRQDTERILYFSPLQAQIQPYSQKKISLIIVGKKKSTDQQNFIKYCNSDGKQESDFLENSWKYIVTFHNDEEEQQIKLNVKGVCMIPKIRLDLKNFDFGVGLLGHQIIKTLRIENQLNLETPIVFPKLNNYSFKPHKVVLQKNKDRVINIVFKPKKVGDHNEIATIEVGVFQLPLKLFAKCKFQTNINTQPNQVPEQSFESLSIIKQNQMSRHINESNIHLNSSILDSSKQQFIVENKEEDVLKLARKQRVQKKKEAQFSKIIGQCKNYEETKPMDYEFENKLSSNIKQTHINLNTSKDPLYLDGKFNNKRQNKSQKPNPSGLFDQNKQIPQLPSVPKNQNEQRIINQSLQPEQLRLIQVSQTMINIGAIFINCSAKANFVIMNGNNHAVSVQLGNVVEEVSKSNKNLQIIPVGGKAAIKIVYSAMRVGEFKHSIQYILNGKHFFEFNIFGNVILPNLTLNRNQLKFFFTEEDKEFYKCEKLVLKNSFDYEAKFKWIASQDRIFQVNPMEGIVGPQSEQTITVKYNINNSSKEFQSQNKVDEDKLRLRIVDGNQMIVKCSSQVNEATCMCKPSELNFKDISVCKSVEQRFFVKNVGRAATVFKIDYEPELEGIIQITPAKKHLSMQETVEVIVKINSTKNGLINTNLLISLRGGKSISLPMKANIILPKVSIKQQEIDFGSTPKSGTAAEKIISLLNESNITVDLELNLGNQDSVLYKCLSLEPLTINDQNLVVTSSKPKEGKLLKPNIYHLKVNPKCQIKLKLSFLPEEILNYNFVLPLTIQRYPQYMPELQRVCNCKGILNKLMVEPKQLDFKRVIIQTEKGLSKSLNIQLQNPTEEPVQWWIGSQDLSPFQLSVKKGKLQGFQTQVIKVIFYPLQPGEFNKQINFYIDQPEMELTHCYMCVSIKACSDFPCIIFDRPYVILPVVPLNIESKCTFQIFNDGYQNLNLKHIIVQELSSIDITLNYLNGTNLGITKKKLKMQATVKSEKPLSFTLNAEFYDENNRVYVIPISGTIDNSMFTIQEYFSANKSYEEELVQIDLQASYIKRYLNTHICVEKPITKFPESLLDNQMEIFFDMLSFYASGYEKIKINNKKGSKIFLQLSNLDDIIRNLKSEGALLNHIRPELLLNWPDYINYIKSKDSANQNYYQVPWAENEDLFNHLNKKYWVILLYQIMKIYDPYRISMVPSKASKSNINIRVLEESANKMTLEQRQLISWAESIYNSQSHLETLKNLQDFSNLMDCEIFAALLLKYTGNKILEGFGKPCNTKKQIQKRAAKLVETLAAIGIYTHIRPEDIERSNHRQMLVFIEQLYSILPNYLPKSQPIQFNCSLGQSVSKSIEISNPSKQTVSYWAKIQGSNDFVMQSQPSFIIESKKSYEFKIKYLSNFSNSSSALITFIGKKDSRTTPATMVFSLKGNTLGRVSEKSIQVSSPLYEQLQFQINVTNNLQSDGEFKIQLFLQQKKQNRFNPFYCFVEKIRIKKSTNTTLNLTFAPMVMDTQKAYLYFQDPNAGEFQYELVGLVEMPQVSAETLRLPSNIFVDTPTTLDISIPLKNDLIIKARKQLELLTQRKSKLKTNTLYPRLGMENYSVQILPSTQMITPTSKEIILNNNEKQDSFLTPTGSIANTDKKEESKKIQLSINIRMTIKQGTILLILKNASKTDIRKYRLVLNVSNKPLKYVMEIKTNLFKQITQPIPLVNPTNQQNIYHVQISQDLRQNFMIDCDKQIHVESGKTEYINLNFKPKSVGQFQANLKLENSTIAQIIEYELVGICQEPEAITLTFNQFAKQQKQYQIKINNPTNSIQRLNVKIDLNHATGPSTFNIPPYTTSSYFFTFNPKFIDEYAGTISFEEDGKYFIYKIKINTKNTPPLREYNLVGRQRQVCNLQIEVQEGEWQISTSDEKLKGSKSFSSTKQMNKYKLTYISGKRQQKKALVYFRNSQQGDFCYQVNINIIEAPPIKLNPFKVELGKSFIQKIYLENLENEKIRVVGKSTNSSTFSFEPSNILIEPKTKFQIQIVYNPSNLETQNAQIVFESELHEKWRYMVSGFGILPIYEEEKIIQGELNKDTSAFINFRNPFKEKIQVNISLQKNPQCEGIFKLIMKNKRVDIEPLGLISIPLVFIPKCNERYQTILLVYMNERMSWKFNIIGVSFYHAQSLHKHYKFKAREKKIDSIELYLHEIHSDLTEQQNEFSLKLKSVVPSKNTQLIEKSLKILTTSGRMNKQTKSLKFEFQFLTFKPFESICTYQIKQKNECKWIIRTQMISAEPQYDDEINIVADINNLASVGFKLTNRFKNNTKFNAYFTPQSDVELSVYPKSGQLAAYGKQGTHFQISFHPTEYRKYRSGKLVIQTEQSYWSYFVKGVLPHYSPPIGVSTLNIKNSTLNNESKN